MNFCDYYKKPFPKKMVSTISGTVVLFTGISVVSETGGPIECGTGTVVSSEDTPFEAPGTLFDDWIMDSFVDCDD